MPAVTDSERGAEYELAMLAWRAFCQGGKRSATKDLAEQPLLVVLLTMICEAPHEKCWTGDLMTDVIEGAYAFVCTLDQYAEDRDKATLLRVMGGLRALRSYERAYQQHFTRAA